MAILVPSLQRVRKQAKAVVCLSNLHQWGLAFSMYANQNEGRMFAAFHGGGTKDSEIWGNALRPYYTEPDLRLCPAATKPHDEGGTVVFGAYRFSPTRNDGDHGLGSYGLSTWAGSAPRGVGEVNSYLTKNQWRSVNVKGAGYIPVLADAQWVDGWPTAFDEPPEYDGEPWSARGWSTGGMRRFCINRHNGFVNGLFMDFSARKIGLKQLWKLNWHRNWTKEASEAGTPVWPDWMKKLKEY